MIMVNKHGSRFSNILPNTGGIESGAPRTFSVVYFGPIREKTGRMKEEILTDSRTPESLYEEIRIKYALEYPFSLLRVAVNGTFSSPEAMLEEGDSVAFLPPFGGG